MPRITIDQIQQELSTENWKLTSTEYKNLDTQMEFKCPEGHKVFSTWGRLRTKRECPVCKQNKFRGTNEIIKKNSKENRVLGLDQATHLTGWSIFDGSKLIQYGVFDAGDNEDEVIRFHEVKMWLMSMIENWAPDIIGIEGIQYQQNMGVTTFQTLARLQGVLLDLCVELGIPYKICPTNTWRAHCKVKGSTRHDKKRSMQLLVKEWYDISITEDEADAIGIGKFVADSHKKQTEIVNWE